MRKAKGDGVVKRVGVRKGRAQTESVEEAVRVVAIEGEGLVQAQALDADAVAPLAAIESEGLLPLGYLLRVMRDESETPARRMDAAKTAAPFLHPKLATMDVQSAGLDRMGDALLELIERAQGDGGGVGGLHDPALHDIVQPPTPPQTNGF